MQVKVITSDNAVLVKIDNDCNYEVVRNKETLKSGKLENCHSNNNIERQLKENSLAKKFFDLHTNSSMSDSVKAEMIKVAQLVEKMGKDIYNAYAYLGAEEYNPRNYAFNAPKRYSKKIKTVQDAQALYRQLQQHYNYCLAIETKTFTSAKELVDSFNNAFCVGGFMKKAYTSVPFLKLNASRRIELLTLLADTSTMPGRWSIGDCPQSEEIILFILKTTPEKQTKTVLDALYTKKLLYKFIDGMNGNNFDQFVSLLTRWVFANYPPKQLSGTAFIAAVAAKKYMVFNDNFFGRRNEEQMNRDGQIHLSVKKWGDSEEEYVINSQPYDYVLVNFKNNFDAGATQFARNQTYQLPALYAYMLMVQDTRGKWQISGKIAIDAGLCLIGIGVIKNAIQSGRWALAALALADMGVGLGDILINTAFKNEIQAYYPDFYDNWQTLSAVYGIGRLAQVGLEAMYRKTHIQATLISVDAKLSDDVRKTGDKIRTQLQNLTEYGQLTKKDYNKITKEFQALNATEWVSGRMSSSEAVNYYLLEKIR